MSFTFLILNYYNLYNSFLYSSIIKFFFSASFDIYSLTSLSFSKPFNSNIFNYFEISSFS